MSTFTVTVRAAGQRYRYQAIGTSSGDVHDAALDRFGGLCSVVVILTARAA